jgi:hypothetical protein
LKILAQMPITSEEMQSRKEDIAPIISFINTPDTSASNEKHLLSMVVNSCSSEKKDDFEKACHQLFDENKEELLRFVLGFKNITKDNVEDVYAIIAKNPELIAKIQNKFTILLENDLAID